VDIDRFGKHRRSQLYWYRFMSRCLQYGSRLFFSKSYIKSLSRFFHQTN